MKVGLIDADGGTFPNLCLMKLSAYHKRRGDHVEWWNGLLKYDRVYMSKVFDDTYTQETPFVIQADEVIRGGTGYSLRGTLPDEIEHIYPDYSLYNYKNALGFLTRGCPRGCPFCIVKEKEGGRSVQVGELSEFFKDQDEIVLLDPNIAASDECERLFEELIATKKRIDFSQGIDVRLLTDKGADQLNRMRIECIHFAWDNYEFKTYEKLKEVRKLLDYGSRRLCVYVLTNFNTTIEQDLERIYKLRELDYDPYVMIYNKPSAPRKLIKIQRWVNSKPIWGTVERFEDYKGGQNGTI